jgi:hypothetical protein
MVIEQAENVFSMASQPAGVCTISPRSGAATAELCDVQSQANQALKTFLEGFMTTMQSKIARLNPYNKQYKTVCQYGF